MQKLLECVYTCSPSLFYLLTVGVEVIYFHLITLRHTTQSVWVLWTRDHPDAETYTWQDKHCARQTSMRPVGFETTIPASVRPQTYTLNRAATGIGVCLYTRVYKSGSSVLLTNCPWAVPCLRRLAAGLPPRRPGFDPGSVHVGFVVDKVALWQVFPRVLRFSPVNFIPPVFHY
jgi:hypothetical protein